MPLQRRKRGGRYPLAIENERIDSAVEAMRLNPGNAYRAASWLMSQLGIKRRPAINLLAHARTRIVAACKADMISAPSELWGELREALSMCKSENDWRAYFRGAEVALKMLALSQLGDLIDDDDDDDDGDVVFRIVESVEVPNAAAG